MRFYAETESGAAELEIESREVSEKHFKAMCRIAYAAIYAVAQIVALYLVGAVALVGLFPAFIVVLACSEGV